MFQIQRQLDFLGGENRKVVPQTASPNQLIRAKNCVLTSEGIVETRLGKTAVNTTIGTGGVVSIHLFPKSNGTTYLCVQHGTSLYATSWDGSSSISSFGTAIKTGLTAGSKLRSVVWKDNIIFTNGTESPFRYDGSSVSNLLGSPPNSKIISVYAGRLWLVDVSNINQVRFSDLEDYDTWNALNVIKVRDNDGDFVTNLSPQEGGIVIFKNRSIYTLYGTNENNFRLTDPIAHNVGCPSYDGVLDEGLFMGNENWFRFSMAEIAPMQETHTILLDDATATEKTASFAVAQTEEQRYYYLLGSDIIVFDANYNGVTSWDDLNANCFAVNDATGHDGALLVGDADNGIVYKIDGDDDDGSNIHTLIKTGYSDQGTNQYKNWRYAWPDIDLFDLESTIPVTYQYDVDYYSLSGSQNQFSSSDYGAWDTAIWDTSLWASETYIQISSPYWLHNVHGRYISHEFSSYNRLRFRGYQTKFEVIGSI